VKQLVLRSRIPCAHLYQASKTKETRKVSIEKQSGEAKGITYDRR
jgi:hypothetical protein